MCSLVVVDDSYWEARCKLRFLIWLFENLRSSVNHIASTKVWLFNSQGDLSFLAGVHGRPLPLFLSNPTSGWPFYGHRSALEQNDESLDLVCNVLRFPKSFDWATRSRKTLLRDSSWAFWVAHFIKLSSKLNPYNLARGYFGESFSLVSSQLWVYK